MTRLPVPADWTDLLRTGPSPGALPPPPLPSPVTPLRAELRVSAGGAPRAHLREGSGLLLFFCFLFFWFLLGGYTRADRLVRTTAHAHEHTCSGADEACQQSARASPEFGGRRHARALVPY